MDGLTRELRRQALELQEFLNNDALEIIAVEGINHIEEAFENEGFTDASLKKWTPRKKFDKKGKNKTVYRTNRVGKAGQPNKYGKQIHGRKILTGHKTGGDKLRYSYKAQKLSNGVKFQTDKPYAKRHNEGLDGMPKRKHIGKSKVLDSKIKNKVDKELNKIFKK